MKEFKVSDTLKGKIENILTRRCVGYSIEGGTLKADISGSYFHRVVVRAKMEKLMEEENSTIPYVAESELNDKLVMDEIGDSYIVK